MRRRAAMVGLAAIAGGALLLFPAAAKSSEPAPIVGRWDLTVHGPTGDYPSWLEVTEKDGQLAGRFTGRTGSVGPVKSVSVTGENVVFILEGRRQMETRYEGRLEKDRLSGKTSTEPGKEIAWEGRRAPELARSGTPRWGQPVALFNGKDLEGWRARYPARQNGWAAQDGRLVNASPGNDLITEKTFTDFQLHAEFRLPKGSNSGIYLRGRYEFQLEDSAGKPPESHELGGIYGFIAPSVNPARPAGEWQTCDITLVGRAVSAVLNDVRIYQNQPIPGITGGALDSDEGAPGPIFLQGDHGSVEFRNLMITPAK